MKPALAGFFSRIHLRDRLETTTIFAARTSPQIGMRGLRLRQPHDPFPNSEHGCQTRALIEAARNTIGAAAARLVIKARL
ncbi:MAG TPA: hypothetical protein VF861_03490 [Telluria sp.]